MVWVRISSSLVYRGGHAVLTAVFYVSFLRPLYSLGMGTMQSRNMGPGSGGGSGHFNPAFMQGSGQQVQQVAPDGPRKRYRVDESG